MPLPVDVFSTAPQSADVEAQHYLRTVKDVARASEQHGCKGILIYTDNRLVDAWLVAQTIIESTDALCPLVAVQPAYMHPYAVANMVASFAYLYERRVYLNMVAGGFRNDLLALGDGTPHDLRYKRLEEYAGIVKALISGQGPVSFSGKFYQIKNLTQRPSTPSHLFPGIFVSGSSEAGRAAARTLGATAIEYPNPGRNYEAATRAERGEAGIRIGIIADEDEREAWRIAWERFPGDRQGQVAHRMAMKVSDSEWHKQLSDMEASEEPADGPYWLWPFKNHKTFCPYLVGSYDRVGGELAKYMRAGFGNFILDIPAEENDLRRAMIAFHRAASML